MTQTAERLGRVGWSARVLLYGTLALLVAQLAATGGGGGGGSGGETDQRGAIEAIARQPLGSLLLGLLTVGLFAYGLWRARSAFVSDDSPIERAAYAASALFHLALALLAATELFGGAPAQQSDDQARSTTASVMALPAGRLGVGVVGLVLLAVGVVFVVRAVRREFLEELRLQSLSVSSRRVIEVLGSVGALARAAVFALVGFFLVQAALRHDPSQAKGLDDALRAVSASGVTRLVLWPLAAGLLAYAAFAGVYAARGRFDD